MQTPLSDFSQQINQIHFDSPAVDLLLLQNHEIKNNTIKISDQMRGKIIQPSMYESWTEPVKQHIKIEYSEIPITQQDPQSNLMIFDT